MESPYLAGEVLSATEKVVLYIDAGALLDELTLGKRLGDRKDNPIYKKWRNRRKL